MSGIVDTVIPDRLDASSVDDTTIEINGASKIAIKDGGVDTTQLADAGITDAKLSAGGIGATVVLCPAHATVVQGTWLWVAGAGQVQGGNWYNQSAGNGDELSFPVFLGKGTYNVTIATLKANNRGIIDIEIGGASIGTHDLYAGGTTFNQFLKITPVAITSSGIKTIGIKTNGKNGSSTGYIIGLSYIIFERIA